MVQTFTFQALEALTGGTGSATEKTTIQIQDAQALIEKVRELTLVTSTGSSDNLQRLLAEPGEVQIALVQSGLEQQLPAAQRARLRSLGAVYHEPLWLFYRQGLDLDRIADLVIRERIGETMLKLLRQLPG